MALKNMELTPEQKNNRMVSVYREEESDGPEYPCGLKIHLEQYDLEKLGIADLPEFGSTMSLKAEVVVCHISQSEDSKCLGLQITKMDLSKEKDASNVSDADVLYKEEA